MTHLGKPIQDILPNPPCSLQPLLLLLLLSQDNRKTFLQRLFRERRKETGRGKETGREESFHCFSYDSFHVLIPLRLLLGDFLHHLTRQICAQRSKKPAGRSIWQCQQWACLPPVEGVSWKSCVPGRAGARDFKYLPCLGALKPNCLAH